MGESYERLDDDDLLHCALDTVLARLRAGDYDVEVAWRQAVDDRIEILALEINLNEPEPHA